ncbi:glycosyltransferase family 9 protein [Coraliomargarita sp. SDUM461004]|uniref:Glycosyltransferase family 9 protein n=1 Tax=Thalassobacterium sedimentorum TaxID=3041258 RepID=A0ABU1AK67_9BACT|nr:glycosyltransferase family 9 protein [Coraliomargarita sp. SDUM461004]MDQ8195149.1 glycosyltransferase family 9 protein [Coraliomargarita sp. SDUM461004]
MPLTTIAFITTHRLGDALSHTPAIRFLKQYHQDAKITVIAPSPEAQIVFEGNPDVDEVLCVSSNKVTSLRGKRYDLTISFCRQSLAIEICKQIHGPQLLLSGITDKKVPDCQAAPPPPHQTHVSKSNVEKLRSLFISDKMFNDFRYTLSFTKADASMVETTLKHLGLEQSPLIALHLGCRSVRKRLGFGQTEITHEKAWRVNNAIDFCNQLAQAFPQVRCLATGTKAEGVYTKKLASACSNVIDTVDRFSIKQAAALMHQLKVCIVPDTGMLHIAASTPVPIVGLYAPTDPAETGPYPGRMNHYPIQKDSMDLITGKIVFDTIAPLLK